MFVPWTAPGDRVRVRVVDSKKRWARALPEEILHPSPDRVAPPCAHFGVCGGCRLQHVSVEEQLRWKGRFVHDALKRIGNLEPEGDIRVDPAPHGLQYRGRMTFTVAHRGGRVRAGLREAGRPGRVAEVEFCHIADPKIQETWSSLRQSLRKPGLLRAGTVVRVTLRAVQEGIVVLFSPRCPGRDGEYFAGLPHVVQVWEGGSKGSRLLWGRDEVHENWFGRAVAVPGPSFTQVNALAGQGLLDAVVEAAGDVKGRKVVDAYAGLSLTGRELALKGASVTAIELDPAATAALAEAGGVRVLEGRVEARLPEALPADLVILNPPRSGLHEHVVHHLL
ncbi:MAG: class I SAM-dependent RNA methyltransferase, partial [Gemmatimonadetes bacterium]|nr:class I SAM-dependent RNA methyltransferase [Gemmatimonadota bacterium]